MTIQFRTDTIVPMGCSTRRLRVRHTTQYVYDRRVRRSVHTVHLKPQNDENQRLISHELHLDPDAVVVNFEDVFGNQASRFEINQPYNTLSITADSLVELTDIDPFAFAMLPIRPSSFPLGWMPWERTMLAPYLMPSELPDTQLREIYDYAMQFVERNGRDLMETLFAINLELFRDYKPTSPARTSMAIHRHSRCTSHPHAGSARTSPTCSSAWPGCSASPPATSAAIIYTGNSTQVRPRAQSDSTHAWVQLYIPDIAAGPSFGPTNGRSSLHRPRPRRRGSPVPRHPPTTGWKGLRLRPTGKDAPQYRCQRDR